MHVITRGTNNAFKKKPVFITFQNKMKSKNYFSELSWADVLGWFSFLAIQELLKKPVKEYFHTFHVFIFIVINLHWYNNGYTYCRSVGFAE